MRECGGERRGWANLSLCVGRGELVRVFTFMRIMDTDIIVWVYERQVLGVRREAQPIDDSQGLPNCVDTDHFMDIPQGYDWIDSDGGQILPWSVYA